MLGWALAWVVCAGQCLVGAKWFMRESRRVEMRIGDWCEMGDGETYDVGMVVGTDPYLRRVLVEWWLKGLDWARCADVRQVEE